MIEIFENIPKFRLKFDLGFVQICLTLVLNPFEKKRSQICYYFSLVA